MKEVDFGGTKNADFNECSCSPCSCMCPGGAGGSCEDLDVPSGHVECNNVTTIESAPDPIFTNNVSC